MPGNHNAEEAGDQEVTPVLRDAASFVASAAEARAGSEQRRATLVASACASLLWWPSQGPYLVHDGTYVAAQHNLLISHGSTWKSVD